MKRKLVKQGPQTLVVSMPSQWIKKNKLEKGNEVEIAEISNNLVISGKSIVEPKTREPYVLNLDEKEDYLTKRYLTMLYRLGYEEIILTFNKSKIKKLKTQESVPLEKFISNLTNRFIGMEIISSEKNKIILKCFTTISPEELKALQRRIFLLMLEFMNNLLNKNYNSNRAHDSITKFINYFFRILNASPEASLEDKEFLYGFFSVQDKLADFLRHIHFEIKRAKRLSKSTQTLLKEIFSLYDDMYHLYYKFKDEKSKEIVLKRYELVRKVHKARLTAPEAKIIYDADFILLMINDFYECLIGRSLSVHTN